MNKTANKLLKSVLDLCIKATHESKYKFTFDCTCRLNAYSIYAYEKSDNVKMTPIPIAVVAKANIKNLRNTKKTILKMMEE